MLKTILLLFAATLAACQPSTEDLSKKTMENIIIEKDYWFDGNAEVNTYAIKQNRYNALHEGQAIVIYVSEDFLTNEQVKNDRYINKNSTPILKKIEQRKFPTGVYDYTIYSSIFTPFDLEKFPKSIKITGSSQEWCGTVFSQLNAQKNGYKATLHSYFESENDQEVKIKKGIPEDELFTRLRMNPELLPIGNFDIIPSPIVGIMRHYPLMHYQAIGSITDYNGELVGDNLKKYTIEIATNSRKLQIIFENQAPYKIIAWYDSYPSAFDQKIRTTEALLINQTKLDYWNKNNPEDQALRKMLKIK